MFIGDIIGGGAFNQRAEGEAAHHRCDGATATKAMK